jgi:hypothetical protein
MRHVVGSVLDEGEPLPQGGIELAAGAFAWRDMESKLAELLHDSLLEDAVVLRDDTAVRLLVFQSGELTLDVEHTPDRLVGALSPAARYHVELQHASGGAGVSVLTDDGGMFALPGPVRGTIRFVVSDPERQLSVLSPWITL